MFFYNTINAFILYILILTILNFMFILLSCFEDKNVDAVTSVPNKQFYSRNQRFMNTDFKKAKKNHLFLWVSRVHIKTKFSINTL